MVLYEGGGYADIALNESPSEKEGKYSASLVELGFSALNESPSEKEGKSPPETEAPDLTKSLNESPSEKEGKSKMGFKGSLRISPLNESPSEKEGKFTH